MANTFTNYAHTGYMAGLRGEAPDPRLENASEYAEGWLRGQEDRSAGVDSNRFLEAPSGLRRGAEVTIPKGTTVKTIYHGVRSAGRTYKVKIHNVYDIVPAHIGYDGKFVRPEPAKVIWPGTGGYWSEAALPDVAV